MTDGLKRIILIDSYIPSEKIEVRLDGHTVIRGKNGKGKTSLLKLIPLFYGVRPGSLIKKGDGGNSGFVNYYLPRMGSYVIYEYQTHGRIMLAVFTSVASKPDSVRRVLIDSPYNPALFYDVDNGSPYPSESLIARSNKLELIHHTCTSTTDYKKQLLESDAGMFCLASKGDKLNHLVKLLTNMFEKKASFSELAMIAQDWSMQTFDSDLQRVLKEFTINKTDLQKTVHDYRALSGLGGLSTQVPKIKITTQNINSHDENMAVIYQLSKEIVFRLTQENIDKGNLFKARAAAVTGEKEALGIKVGDQQVKVNIATKAELKAVETVTALQERHDIYTEQGVPGYESEIKLIGSKRAELTRLENAALSEDSDAHKATQEIDKQRLSVNETAESGNRLLSESQNTILVQKNSAISDIDKRKGSALNDFDEEADLKHERLRKSESDLNSKQALAHAAISSVTATVTTTGAVVQANKNTLSIDQQREEQQLLVNGLQSEAIQCRIDLDTTDDNYREWTDEKEGIDTKLSELVRLQNEPDSLYHFLNDNVDDWKASFGKILANNILMNKRLSPKLINNDQTMFGVSLDLDSLPERQTDIDAEIIKLTSALKSAIAEYNLAEKRFEKAGELHRLKFKDHAAAVLELQRIANQLISARATIKSLVSQSKSEISTAKTLAEAHYNETVLIHKNAELDMEAYGLQRKEDRKKIEDKFKGEAEKAQAEYEASLLSINKQKQEVESTKKEALLEIKAELDRKLKGFGIDPEVSAARNEKISALRGEIETLDAKETRFNVYSKFMVKEYQYIEKLRTEESFAIQAKRQSESELTRIKDELGALVKVFDDETAKHDQVIEANEINIRSTGSIINVYDETDVAVSAELKSQWELVEASRLKNSYIDFDGQRRKLIAELKDKSKPFIELFGLHPDAVSYQYYTSNIESYSQNGNVLACAEVICRYYDDGHHQTAIDALSNGLSILRTINAYKGALEQFERRINLFNEKLNSNMRKAIRFESLTHVSVNIKFTPRDIEHWHSIDQLSNSFQKWSTSNNRSKLPDKHVIMAMRDFISSMPGDRMGSTVENLWRHINFLFEIVENGKSKQANSEAGLIEISSNGLAYIIMIVTFIGFIDVQRGENKTPLTWSLDELTNIDSGNIDTLLDMLSEKNISMVAACPRLSYSEVQRFNNRYLFETENNKTVIIDQRYIKPKASPFDDHQEDKA